MTPPDTDVSRFLAAVTPDRRRRDAETLLDLFGRVTGEQPALWGSIVGFGSYHYRYASGREGDTAAVGFAPRKAASTIYLVDGCGAYSAELERLGPHSTGVGCLYLKDLSTVDLEVLGEIVGNSYRAHTAVRLICRPFCQVGRVRRCPRPSSWTPPRLPDGCGGGERVGVDASSV